VGLWSYQPTAANQHIFDDFLVQNLGQGYVPGSKVRAVENRLVKVRHRNGELIKAQLLQAPPSGHAWTSYYFAGSARIAMRVQVNGSTDQVYYLLADHLGSTTVSYRVSDGYTTTQKYYPWGELRPGPGTSLPTGRTYTGQRWSASIGLSFFNARWYDGSLGRFAQADSIIPGGVQGLDRYTGMGNNPVKYIDPDGHWPCSFSSSGFSCSLSTFGLSAAVNRVGERLGVENASDIVSGAMSNIGLGLDIAAGAVDFAASAIVTTGIVVGATGGAVITLPGGGTAVVTGAAGASVGWATAELGVKPLILAGNALASLATLATVSSELISGDTGFESALGISAEGVEMSSQVAIGSASQVSTWATTAGWISPLAYPSLGIQTVAILGDLGVVSPPPISIGLAASFPKEPKAVFRLKFGDVEVR
jgi:RHS repeat-associated protein